MESTGCGSRSREGAAQSDLGHLGLGETGGSRPAPSEEKKPQKFISRHQMAGTSSPLPQAPLRESVGETRLSARRVLPLPGSRHLPKHLTHCAPLKTPPPRPLGHRPGWGSGEAGGQAPLRGGQPWPAAGASVTARPTPGRPPGSERASPPELGSHPVPPSGGRCRESSGVPARLWGCQPAGGREVRHATGSTPTPPTPQPSGRSPQSQAFGTRSVKQRKQRVRSPMAQRGLPGTDGGMEEQHSAGPGRHVGSSRLEVP